MGDRIGIKLGRRIKQLREARGLTQAAFAQVSRKSVETISNFERGKTLPSLQTLSALAEILEVDVADLFDRESKKPNTTLTPQASLLSADEIEMLNALIKVLHQRRSRSGRKR
jgi:transcriptional regulator with XRE-family HTH domain